MDLYNLLSISKCPWSSLANTIEMLFPDQKANISLYRGAYYSLAEMPPIMPPLAWHHFESIEIHKNTTANIWSVTYHRMPLVGLDAITSRDVFKRAWNTILGFGLDYKIDDELIDIEMLTQDGQNELAAVLLYEMTLCGFSEREISIYIENNGGERPDCHV